jgi:hypothetical protein
MCQARVFAFANASFAAETMIGPFPVEWTQGLAARLVGSFRDGFDTP